MTVWIVEFDHKHGTEIWAASDEKLAEEIVRTVKKHLFREYGDDTWTLKKAMDDWTAFSGGSEYFRINEVPLISTLEAAKKAKA
jgi:hypothetical protein